MSIANTRQSQHKPYIFSALGGLLLSVWGVSVLTPTLHGLMLDSIASFLFNLLVTVVLWWAVRQSENPARSFWRGLAWAWVLNIAGNLAWAGYDFVTGGNLAIFSWINGFYIARYGLVFWTFWRYPRRKMCVNWVAYGALLAASTALIWAAIVRPAQATLAQPFMYLFRGALYPMMDVGLLYVVLEAWTNTTEERMCVAMRWLFMAFAAYGIADWLNFSVRLISFEVFSPAAGVFWVLADLGIGVAALYAAWPRVTAALKACKTPATTILTRVPAFAALLTVGVVGVDGFICYAVDVLLLSCAVIALAFAGYRRVFPEKEDGDESIP